MSECCATPKKEIFTGFSSRALLCEPLEEIRRLLTNRCGCRDELLIALFQHTRKKSKKTPNSLTFIVRFATSDELLAAFIRGSPSFSAIFFDYPTLEYFVNNQVCDRFCLFSWESE